MPTFDKCHVFWDGVPNVRADGSIDHSIPYKFLNDCPPAPVLERTVLNQITDFFIRRTEPGQPGRNTINVQGPISVDIIKVDEWFVPIRDMLAIKLRLGERASIRSLMLRVYDCRPLPPPLPPAPATPAQTMSLIFQCVLLDNEILRLPSKDISINEQTAVKQRRKQSREDRGLRQSPCMTHARVEVWVSAAANAFLNCDANTPPNYAAEKHDKSLPRPSSVANDPDTYSSTDEGGRNETVLGCDLIEDVMEGRTAITIYDHEPTDALADGRRGDGVTSYPDFRRQIRKALYQICANTTLGLELLRVVAQTRERAGKDTRVHIYPSQQVAKFIEGVGVDPAQGVTDDATVDALLQVVKNALRNGAWPAAGPAGWIGTWPPAGPPSHPLGQPVPYPPADPNPNPVVFVGPGAIPFGPTAAAAGAADAKLAFAARRLVHNIIGASDGRGCVSKFFFHATSMRRLDADGYVVVRHQLPAPPVVQNVNWIDHVGSGMARTLHHVNQCACMGDRFAKVGIETPLFLALAHEFVHARRYQLGMNSEHEKIATDNVAANHPASMIAQIPGAVGTPGARLRKNIKSRYAGYNLEEFDTIEGIGAPLRLEKLSTEGCQRLIATGVLPPGAAPAGPHNVNVTENLFRQELQLESRHRYVDGITEGTDVPVPNADLAPRRFIKARRARPAPPELTTASFADIQTQMNRLHTEVGLPARAVVLAPNVNYFRFADPQFGWSYLYGHTFDDEGQRIQARDIFDEIRRRNAPPTPLAATMGIVDPTIGAALNAIGAALPAGGAVVTDPHKVQCMQDLLVALLRANAPADVERMKGVFKLKESANKNSNAEGIEAFASLRQMNNPVLANLSDRAMYLPDHEYDDPKTLCHMLIHEPMHMHSFQVQGFTLSDSLAALGPRLAGLNEDAIRKTFNEGTTELLARIMTFRLNCISRDKGKGIVSKVDVFGGIPSYEYPTHLMCQLVRDLNANGQPGLRLLTRAFLEGEWANLNNAILAIPPGTHNRYTAGYFAEVQNVAHEGALYSGALANQTAIGAVTNLKNNYQMDWDLPSDLIRRVSDSSYKDPVLFSGANGKGDPLASDTFCMHADGDQPPLPLDLDWECQTCHASMIIPSRTILKPNF